MADVSIVTWGLAVLATALAFAVGWLAVDRKRQREEAASLAVLLEGERELVRRWRTCAEAWRARLFAVAPRQPARTVQLPALSVVDPDEFKRTIIRQR